MDTCPKTRLFHGKGKGDEEKQVGGKRKQTLQDKREQVTIHPEGWTFIWRACVTWTMHVTCLTSLEPKCTWKTLKQNGSCFRLTAKTHSGLSADNSLSCSWNNSYCAFGPRLAASVWTQVQFSSKLQKKSKASALFLTMGEWRWHFPHTRAFSPVWWLWGCHYRPLATQPPGTTFPKDQLPPSWRFPKKVTTSLDKTWAGFISLGSRSIQTGRSNLASMSKNTSPSDDHCLHWQTNFWGKIPKQPRCLWTAPHGADQPHLANSWGLQGLPSSQALGW